MTNTSISDTVISEARRANHEWLFGPPDSSTPDELRWTNVRLRGTAVVGGGTYDPTCHEQVVYHHDAASNLCAIVAVHSTVLGPSLGGTRWYPYASEEDALRVERRLTAAGAA